MELNLMYDDKTEDYYWIGRDNCQKCNKPIIHFGFLLWDFWKNHFKQYIYCYNCKAEIRKASGKYQEFKKVFIVLKEDLPSNSIGIFPEKPLINNGRNLDVFDVATRSIDGEQIVDKTIQCHNSNFMIQSDAKNPELIEAELNKSERLISSKDLNREFSDILGARALGSRFDDEDRDNDNEDDDTKLLK